MYEPKLWWVVMDDASLDQHRVREQLHKHPDTVPAIIRPDKDFYARLTPAVAQRVRKHLEVTKYAPPRDWTVARLMTRLRTRIDLPPKYALFMFLSDAGDGHVLPCNTATLGELYEAHRSLTNGILYITLTIESTFGGPVTYD